MRFKKVSIIFMAVIAVIFTAVYLNSSAVLGANSSAYLSLFSNSAGTDVYSCPMHPEVTQDKAGSCPKCGMDLALNVKKTDNAGMTAMDCCNENGKCKDTGCDMEKCKEHAGACSEQCVKNADVNKDIKMMDKDEKMDHGKCGKKGSCCDK